MLLLVSVGLAVCGLLCLRTAWRLRAQANGWRISLGWLALLGALCLGYASSGTDKGVALALIAIMLIALLVLGRSYLSSEIRRSKPANRIARHPQTERSSHWLSGLWTGMVMGPLSGLASLAINTALYDILAKAGADPTLNLTLVAFAFPLVWAGLAILSGYQVRLWRRTLPVLLSGGIPLLYILSVTLGGTT